MPAMPVIAQGTEKEEAVTYIRRLLILLVLAIVGCAPALSPARSSHHELRSLQASLILYDQDDNLICSAVRISPTRIVSAYHCAVAGMLSEFERDMAGDMDVPEEYLHGRSLKVSSFEQFAEGDATVKGGVAQDTAVFYDADPLNDVVVFVTQRSAQPWVVVRHSSLDLGDYVYAVGHPGGVEFTVTWGRVSVPERTVPSAMVAGQRAIVTQVDITTWGGNSGGGLFDDEGRLVGLSSTSYRPLAIANFSHLGKIVQND